MSKKEKSRPQKVFLVFNTIMLVLYIICLLYALFLKDYMSFERRTLYAKVSIQEYVMQTCNFIPFKTIGEYVMAGLKNEMNLSIVFSNLLGNIILFMPAAYFALVLSDVKLKKYCLKMFILIFAIEVTQIIVRLGSFDVDDIILNMFGTIISFIILYKIKKKIIKN